MLGVMNRMKFDSQTCPSIFRSTFLSSRSRNGAIKEARCRLSPRHYPPSITHTEQENSLLCSHPSSHPSCVLSAPPARVPCTEVENLCFFHPARSALNERWHRSLTSSSAAFQKWWLFDAPLSLILEVLASDFSSTPPAYHISSGRRLVMR